MKAPIFTIADSSVYIPDSRIRVEEIIHELSGKGSAMLLNAEECRENGFEQLPLEQTYSLEQMIVSVCAPLLIRARQEGARVAAILFFCVTNSGIKAQELFAGLLQEFAPDAPPVLQLEEYGCASFHLSLHLAKAFFAGMARNDEAILFVTADKARNARERSDSFMLFGDAASAALYRKPASGGQQVLAAGLKVDGIAYDGSPEQIKMYFSTFYLSVRQVVNQVMREAGVGVNELSLVFCTNLGLGTWRILAKVLGFPIQLFYADTLGNAGHLHNTDILLNVTDAVRRGKLRKGDIYLAITVGFGGYYGCSLHKCE